MTFQIRLPQGRAVYFFRIMEIIVKKTLLVLLLFFITHSTYAITPAKKGINVPLYLVEEEKTVTVAVVREAAVVNIQDRLKIPDCKVEQAVILKIDV